MEPKDFDFQQSANAYILAIKQKGGLSLSDEKELKAHLQDGTESLRQKGLSEEEAFLVAARRLGGTDELSLEYSKVNPVLVTNRIWAYLLAGFGILTSVRLIYVMAYQLLYAYLGDHAQYTILLYTGANFLVCTLIWSVLKWGHGFTGWLQRTIESRAWPIILSSLALPAFTWILRPFSLFNGPLPNDKFGSPIAQFSSLLIWISLISVTLLSVYSIARPGRVRFRSLFDNPSVLFSILFGTGIFFLAAATRVFNTLPIQSSAAIYGILYMAGAFCIGYFSTRKLLLHLGLFSLSGLFAFTWDGMIAYRERVYTSWTHTNYTLFVMSIVVGILAGYFLARMVKDRWNLENI